MRPFEGVVKPTKGRLSLYTLGPGFGESSVLVLPEGEVVVVDSCMEGDVHLTLELLEELGLPRVDLLLVTHADLDHVRPAPLETWAIIAPFQNAGVTLPGLEVLRELHGRGVRLGICDAGAPAALAKTAGWREDPSVTVVCEGPLIGLSWDEAGLEEATRGRRAGVYVVSP